MKHLEESRIITIHGRTFTVFNDGSILMHGKGAKRRFGHTTYKGYKATIVRDKFGKNHTVFVHRLVAMAFIPNNENRPQVNHLNGDKTDNRPENLEWCTNLENRQHRSEVLKHYGRRTPVRCVETGKEYVSAQHASKEEGINRGNIMRCLDKPMWSAGGYHWERV